MNSVNRPYRILIFTALGTAVTAFALRLISLLFFYDAEIGYYSVGTVLPVISSVTVALSAIALIVLSLFRGLTDYTVSAPSGLSRWCALIPALALAFRAVQLIAGAMSATSLTHILSLVGAIAGAGFFCCLAFVDKHSGITVACGTGFIAFLAIAWISSYTDFTVAMNSPDKLFFNLACVGAALFTVGELRAAYDSEKARTYHCYASLALLTLAAGPAVAVLGNILGKYSGNASRGEDLTLMALAIYVAVRLATLKYDPIVKDYEGEIDIDSLEEHDGYYEAAEQDEQTEATEQSNEAEEN